MRVPCMETMESLFTRADYARLPEGFPAQLIGGILVKEPAPTYGHQTLVGRLRDALVSVVPRDLVVISPTDVAIDDHNVFQPDVVVLREIPPLDASEVGIPLVAFGVLSPSTASRDRGVKRSRLLRAGVEEVWLIDAEERAIEVWRGDTEVVNASERETVASRVLPGFQLTPRTLLAPPRAT